MKECLVPWFALAFVAEAAKAAASAVAVAARTGEQTQQIQGGNKKL